jgi:hypothetical protein
MVSTRPRLTLALLALATGSCGGDTRDVSGPQPLVADPAVATGCLADAPAPGKARAKLVACAEEVPPGRLAVGRVGDIVMQNARVTIVIRGFGEGYVLSGTGPGGIVDAATVGGEDLVREIVPLVELNTGAFDELVITEAGDDGPAEVVVRGPAAPVPLIATAVGTMALPAVIEQRYLLEPDSDALLMRTRVWGDASAQRTVQIADALFLGGRVRPFVPGRGHDPGAVRGAFLASSGTTSSYGLVYPRETAETIQLFNIDGFNIALGALQLIGGFAPTERWLLVGDGSVASVTEQAWARRGDELGAVHGETAPGVDVVVADAAGAPATIGRAGDDGTYRVAVPPGSYQVRAESPERARSIDSSVQIAAGAEVAADVAAGERGAVTVRVTDGDGAALPARVMLIAADGGERRIDYTGASGALELAAPPGTYALVVSRGMEYDAFTMDPLEIAAGEQVAVDATLTRVVDTAGWISMDTHLHSEMSNDSTFPLDLRLLAVAAEGVEVAVSSDHDFITDYQPVIDELGLEAWVAARTGDEVSSLIWGHLNGWPLVPDPDRAGMGTVAWQGRSPGETFDLIRGGDPARLVQVNHPRHGSNGLFNKIQFDRETLSADADPALLGLPPGTELYDADFDALEVANDFAGDEFEDSLLDWLALVAAGHPAAATGSSDSHGASRFAGSSRTYVYVGDGNDTIGGVDLDEVDRAIKARHVVIGQGSFVTAGIVDAAGAVSLPGDVVDRRGAATATVAIRVQAPPWMPLAKIRIYAGRDVAMTIPLDPADTAAVRYDDRVELPLVGSDTFFVVRVDPAGPGEPVLGQPDASFTNPLLVDADGDGMWRP